jgi:alpha-tubulin suppressor-like RCC1 family protein
MILLYIHPSVEKQDILVKNTQVDYKFTTKVDINDLQQYDRIGFLYHQQGYFPFVLNEETNQPSLDYFSNNWIQYFETADIIIDLITCDYSSDLQDILSGYTLKSVIHYSTDTTGNTPIGDWVLEKTINSGSVDVDVNVDVKDLYFEDGIENWDVHLGSTAGVFHSLVLDNTGNVYSFGQNNYGQLGLGHETDVSLAQPIPDISNIKAISAGCHHSLVLDNDGNVYSFGLNNYGQLGLGNKTTKNSAQLIRDISNIKAISAGVFHSLVLDITGNVYGFGSNGSGQLGLGNKTDVSSAQQITDISNIKAISAGAYYSLVLDNDGNVYSFGYNRYGQLGLGHKTTKKSAQPITDISNIKAISAGHSHSLVLDIIGNMYSFGYNGTGQLGLGHNTDVSSAQQIRDISNIKAISAGNGHSLVLDITGKVYSFGYNGSGQLGLGDKTTKNSAQLIRDISTIKAISAGDAHSLVLENGGNVYSFGKNDKGQLGLGHETDVSSAQLIEQNIGDKNIIGLMDSITVRPITTNINAIHILENNIGQLRLLRSTYIELYNSNFKDIFNKLPKSNVLRIYANDNAFCYIRKDNRNTEYEYLYAFGDNYSGGTLPTLPYTIKSNQSDQFSYLFVEKNFQSSYKIVHTKYAFALLNKYNNKLYLWGHPLFGGNYQGLNIVENCSNVFANDYAFLVVRDNNPTSPVFTTGHPLYGGDMFQLQSLFSNANANVQYTIQNVYHTKTSFTLRLLDTNDKNHYITLGIHNTDIIE